MSSQLTKKERSSTARAGTYIAFGWGIRRSMRLDSDTARGQCRSPKRRDRGRRTRVAWCWDSQSRSQQPAAPLSSARRRAQAVANGSGAGAAAAARQERSGVTAPFLGSSRPKDLHVCSATKELSHLSARVRPHQQRRQADRRLAECRSICTNVSIGADHGPRSRRRLRLPVRGETSRLGRDVRVAEVVRQQLVADQRGVPM
jgi:hypothetical protein